MSKSHADTGNVLEVDYTYGEVAAALRMSERWVRAQVAAGAEHNRYGHKVRFTPTQVEKLRARNTRAATPTTDKVTTGPSKSKGKSK